MWEFYTKLNYFVERKREKAVEFQILAAIALNPHTKKPKSPDRLIRVPGQQRREMTPEQRKKDIERLMKLYHNGKRFKC